MPSFYWSVNDDETLTIAAIRGCIYGYFSLLLVNNAQPYPHLRLDTGIDLPLIIPFPTMLLELYKLDNRGRFSHACIKAALVQMIDPPPGQVRIEQYLVDSLDECALSQRCHRQVLLAKIAYSIQVMCSHIRNYSKSLHIVEELKDVCSIAREATLCNDHSIVAVYWRPNQTNAYTLYDSGLSDPALWYIHGDKGFIIAKFENDRNEEIEVLNSCLKDDGTFETFKPPPIPRGVKKKPASKRNDGPATKRHLRTHFR